MTLSNQFQEQNEILVILGTRHTLTMRMSVEQVYYKVMRVFNYIIAYVCILFSTSPCTAVAVPTPLVLQ